MIEQNTRDINRIALLSTAGGYRVKGNTLLRSYGSNRKGTKPWDYKQLPEIIACCVYFY